MYIKTYRLHTPTSTRIWGNHTLCPFLMRLQTSIHSGSETASPGEVGRTGICPLSGAATSLCKGVWKRQCGVVYRQGIVEVMGSFSKGVLPRSSVLINQICIRWVG